MRKCNDLHSQHKGSNGYSNTNNPSCKTGSRADGIALHSRRRYPIGWTSNKSQHSTFSLFPTDISFTKTHFLAQNVTNNVRNSLTYRKDSVIGREWNIYLMIFVLTSTGLCRACPTRASVCVSERVFSFSATRWGVQQHTYMIYYSDR